MSLLMVRSSTSRRRTSTPTEAYASLTAIVDTYLVDITWHEDFRETNASPNLGKKTIQVTEGTTITNGKETSVSFGISAVFEAIGLSFGAERKMFSSVEKSKSKPVTTEIPITADATSIYYQRYYHHKSHVWFLSDQSKQESVVYNNGKVYDGYFETEVLSTDHALLLGPLTGTVPLVDVKTATPASQFNLPKLTSRRDYGDLVSAVRSAVQNYLDSL